MDEKITMTLPFVFDRTVSAYAEHDALALVGDRPLTWAETDARRRALMALLEKCGIHPGDKVALLGTNMPHWVVAYFAVASMGGVVVPLLPDFTPREIDHILSHSGTKALIVSAGLRRKTQDNLPASLRYVLAMEDFAVIGGEETDLRYEEGALPQKEYEVREDDLAAIIYTSGTTGKSKGVMLTHRNLVFNALKGKMVHPIGPYDRFLSILPLSHTYENTIGMLIPVISGSCIYYLGKMPTPSLLLPALKKVRPTLMLTVPLIIERIYKKQILPAFTKNKLMSSLYKIPPVRRMLNRLAGKKLMKTFGGELGFFGIGGAKLNKTVEEFLLEARFPYAVGYGLTETSPLIAGFGPHNQRLQSTGPPIEGLEVIIHDPDPETGEGEIWMRGPSVMKGYYREPEMTRQVLTPDGWFRTGDLGVFDRDGYLYIKGRLKNVIVGPGGENIYPDDIESVINQYWFVDESLVIEEKGKLVALVNVNVQALEKKFNELKESASEFYEDKIESLLDEVKEYVNSRVNKFSRVNKVKLQKEPFIKTATNKIKRFMYQSKS